MSFTKCCNLKYIGENHNPLYFNVCRNCGDGLPELVENYENVKKENEMVKDLLLKGVNSTGSIGKFAQWIRLVNNLLKEK